MSSFHVALFLGVLLVTTAAPPSSAARPGGDLECRFQCPASLKPSPRPLHKRSSNGCGTEAFRLPASALPHPDFEACCNEHDLCYDTCLADKAQCDRSFDACMARICDTKVAVKDSCVSTAGLFTTMTKNMAAMPSSSHRSKRVYAEARMNYSCSDLCHSFVEMKEMPRY